MGTRSNIGILCDDGKVAGVYCHWDGYVEHNGRILYENYRDTAKVIRLIQGGNISSLGEHVAPEDTGKPLVHRHEKGQALRKHTFDDPAEGVTVFYGRDRGERDQGAHMFDNIAEFRSNMEEFAYLFNPKTGEWKWCNSYSYSKPDKWYDLKPSQWEDK